MKNIVFDGVRVLQAENEDFEKYYVCKGKHLYFFLSHLTNLIFILPGVESGIALGDTYPVPPCFQDLTRKWFAFLFPISWFSFLFIFDNSMKVMNTHLTPGFAWLVRNCVFWSHEGVFLEEAGAVAEDVGEEEKCGRHLPLGLHREHGWIHQWGQESDPADCCISEPLWWGLRLSVLRKHRQVRGGGDAP